MADHVANNAEVKYTKEESTTTSLDEFSAPNYIKEEPELHTASNGERAIVMADIGEVKCVKLEPELVDINDSGNKFQELPVKIKEDPEVNFSCGGSGRTLCWSANGAKEEWIDGVAAKELDVDPLDSCSDTGIKCEAGECSKLNEEFSVMSQALEEKKPHVCDLCGSGFVHKKSLRNHMRGHTGEKSHVCDICGLGCNDHSNLKRHKRIHTGERPYVCDICGKGFKRTSHLEAHVKTHTGEKPFSCDICGSGFRRKEYLKLHMRMHTGERPYVCDICNKAFKLGGHLKGHMRIHTGERPYVCEICGKGFGQNDKLKEHIYTHTNGRPHVCSVCGLGFNNSSTLRKHKGRHSGKNLRPVARGCFGMTIRRNI